MGVKLVILAAMLLFMFVQFSLGFDRLSFRYRVAQTAGIVLLAVAVTIA